MSLLLHMRQIATSVVATSGYFGDFFRPMAEINACRVSCTKHAHGAYGSRDYSCHQDADTTALLHVFGSAKHFHATNLEGEACRPPVQICHESCTDHNLQVA
jgi:hypothetical protein